MKQLVTVALLLTAMPLAAEQDMPDPGQMFLQQFDANKDGTVSLAEFRDPQLRRMKQNLDRAYQEMDQNHNGSVDSGEATAYMDKMRERMQQMRQQQGGGQR